jgi:hypothetical protein
MADITSTNVERDMKVQASSLSRRERDRVRGRSAPKKSSPSEK